MGAVGDQNGNGGKNGHAITWGIVKAVAPLAIMGLVAAVALSSDHKALAQRVDKHESRLDKGDTRDDEINKALNQLNAAIVGLQVSGQSTKAEIERQGRQLERIESLLRGTPSGRGVQ